ncbi:DUF6252 family protein [Dinghuibacter silviterrae]|uniref:Lipocalin-like protein n=1 Tax=Dinghuibacter silviterrae TaxID=1539049 RepID=A0A4R8DG42_9BACT|nr:DUF6252 family protein [Dinghuibacter silviterrae]TDW96076.1 hypothetical protein EDB95_3898 [Dinghuibacter silviterrae]
MKNWKLLLWTLVAATPIFSCQKMGIGTTATGTSDTSAVFSATIAGTAWTADSVTAVLVYGSQLPDKVLTLTGKSSGKIVTLSIQDTAFSSSTDSSLTVKEYSTSGLVTGTAFQYAIDTTLRNGDTTWVPQLSAETGETTVTSTSASGKTVTGTFAFTGIICVVDSTHTMTFDTVAITNGVFKNINYTFVKTRF